MNIVDGLMKKLLNSFSITYTPEDGNQAVKAQCYRQARVDRNDGRYYTIYTAISNRFSSHFLTPEGPIFRAYIFLTCILNEYDECEDIHESNMLDCSFVVFLHPKEIDSSFIPVITKMLKKSRQVIYTNKVVNPIEDMLFGPITVKDVESFEDNLNGTHKQVYFQGY
jgi:hypothetical protein